MNNFLLVNFFKATKRTVLPNTLINVISTILKFPRAHERRFTVNKTH